jgi:dolichol-phosphate mannosyltransferase
MKANDNNVRTDHFWRFLKFCLVGGSGVIVDMTGFYFLADSKYCGIAYPIAKVCAAETALLNNFIWNEIWTFRVSSPRHSGFGNITSRLLKFHAICGLSILWAVFFLFLFHRLLGLNLYLANLIAIALVTGWNYWLNARFNWRIGTRTDCHSNRG